MAKILIIPKSKKWLEMSERTNEMFKNMSELFRRFIYFEDSLLYTLSIIYVLLTYLYDIFDEIPYLLISGLKASGNSRLGDLFAGLGYTSFNSSEISEAALYREIENRHCNTTMIIDEADDLQGSTRRSILLRVLRSGYRRNGNVTRSRSNGSVVRFATFCPKIMINEKGIQDSALESRTIPIHMIKSIYPLEKFRFSKIETEFKGIKELIRSFSEEYRDFVSDEYTSFEGVEGMQGRDEEIWAPIFIIADTLDKSASPFIKDNILISLRDSMLTLAKKIILQRKRTQLIGNMDAQILEASRAYIEQAAPLNSDGLYVGEELCRSIRECWSIPGLRLETVSRTLKRHDVLTGIKRSRLHINGKSSVVQRTCYLLDKEKLSKLTDEYFDEK
jgi:hypothetical protein